MGLIRCVDQEVDAYTARHAPWEFERQLRTAKQSLGYAECLCTHPPKRLAIRERAGRHWLAVYPLDGTNHDQDCPFRREDSGGGQAADSLSAILETDTGVDVRLDLSLVTRKPKDGKRPASPAEARTPKTARRRTTLLALLEALWTAGDLSRWVGGWTRDYGRVKFQLDGAARTFTVNRRPLDQNLYVPPPFRAEDKERIRQDWSEFRDSLRATAPDVDHQSKLIAGEINYIEATQYGFAIRLRHHAEPIYLTAAVHQQLEHRYPRAVSALAQPQGRPMRVFGLLCVEITSAGHVRMTEAGLMGLSREYLPVDSGYEAWVADLLVDQRRTFDKPLQVQDGDILLPDFVLLDTDPATPMEVFGMKTEAYLARKAAKLLSYQGRGAPLWQWDAADDAPVPPFPPRARRVR